MGSGVARVPYALGQEICLRAHQQKLQSLKWKIGAKLQKMQSRTFSVFILLFFEGNKNAFSARKELGRNVIVGGKNNTGSGEKPPAAGGKRRSEPPEREAIFIVFPQKYTFLSILWSKFLLKTRF